MKIGCFIVMFYFFIGNCLVMRFSTFAFSRYLTVQFVRFFWKRESNQKAKILRVTFTIFPLLFCLFWGRCWVLTNYPLKILFVIWNLFYCLCAWLSQKVDYPLELDVYDFCSDDLRKKLDGPRQVSFLSLYENLMVVCKKRKMFALYSVWVIFSFSILYL